MCNPLLAAGAIMTVASVVAKDSAASKVAKAREGAMDAERTRQRGFDSEAALLNDQSRDRYQGFGDQQAQKAQELSSFFAGQAQPLPQDANAATGAVPSSSNITVKETQRQLGKAKKFGQQQDQAMSTLRAFGDLLGGISREQARDASQIGIIGGFKQGSQAMLPYELEAANSKGAGTRMFGDILGGLGSVAMGAGMGGAAGAAGSAAGGSAGSLAGRSYVPGPNGGLYPHI